jgi:hypothetical protein
MLGENGMGPPPPNGEVFKCKKLADSEAFEIMNKVQELFAFPPERFKELTKLEL